jgi:hypothetical protein
MPNTVVETITGASFPISFPSVTFTPSSLGSALGLWLAADQGVTLGTGGGVAAWQGLLQSSGITLSQASVANQIPLVANAQNGKPGIQATVFSGSGQQSISAAGIISAIAYQPNQPFTMTMAFRRGTPTGGQEFFMKQAVSNSAPGWYFLHGSTTPYDDAFSINGSSHSLESIDTAALAAGTNYVLQITYDGNLHIAFYLNGNLISSGNAVATLLTTDSATPTSPFGINNYSGFGSSDMLFELIINSGALTTAQLSSLVNYLRSSTRWNF